MGDDWKAIRVVFDPVTAEISILNRSSIQPPWHKFVAFSVLAQSTKNTTLEAWNSRYHWQNGYEVDMLPNWSSGTAIVRMLSGYNSGWPIRGYSIAKRVLGSGVNDSIFFHFVPQLYLHINWSEMSCGGYGIHFRFFKAHTWPSSNFVHWWLLSMIYPVNKAYGYFYVS
jgi:hypothetical protein